MSLNKTNNRSKWKRNNAKLKNKDKLAVYTYPSLHDDVLEAIGGTISPTPYFNEVEDDGTAIREYDTNIMGRFQCSDQNWYGLCFCFPSQSICTQRSDHPANHSIWCSSQPGWGSGVVAIHIRQFDDNSYNADVFGQRCKKCNKLGVLAVNQPSYVDRISYRLKKWAGIDAERPEYVKREMPPHRAELCEGCKRGRCRQSRSGSGYLH
jgi:hypothetical protein